jgi:hypothetical protein
MAKGAASAPSWCDPTPPRQGLATYFLVAFLPASAFFPSVDFFSPALW